MTSPALSNGTLLTCVIKLTQQVEFTNIDGQNSFYMTLALESGVTDNDSVTCLTGGLVTT